MEQIDLTVPIVPPSTLNWKTSVIHLDMPNGVINITVVNNNGIAVTKTYTGASATSKMIFLNTANLSVKSLNKRILEMLIADFPEEFAGTISGTP